MQMRIGSVIFEYRGDSIFMEDIDIVHIPGLTEKQFKVLCIMLFDIFDLGQGAFN